MTDSESDEIDGHPFYTRPRFVSLRLTNFLSYKDATVDFGDVIALVGPNASGKSNFVSAVKLLREIGTHGLPVAIARRGGFDQLRHRSNGRPNNPALRITFKYPQVEEESYYEIAFASVAGGTYKVKEESANVFNGARRYTFASNGATVLTNETLGNNEPARYTVAPGHSAVTGAASMAGYLVYTALSQLQTVEISPQVLREFQEPTSLGQFEPDGSNVISVYDSFDANRRSLVVDRLNAIVPGITKVEVSSLAGQQTLKFGQQSPRGVREFSARQMSDGTLKAFGILVALFQPANPMLVVIEEPEIAIHLGALRTLIDILQTQASSVQLVLTTHSSDIVDQLPVDAIRVVWTDGDRSRIAPVSEEAALVVKDKLLTVGELMRSHALDPEENE
jgi:predicted ATPase